MLFIRFLAGVARVKKTSGENDEKPYLFGGAFVYKLSVCYGIRIVLGRISFRISTILFDPGPRLFETRAAKRFAAGCVWQPIQLSEGWLSCTVQKSHTSRNPVECVSSSRPFPLFGC